MSGNAPRTVVITGASSGIGQAIAMAFARRGDRIVVHGHRNLEGLAATTRGMSQHLAAEDQRAILADIADPEAIPRLVAAAFTWRGRVDVWINAAGADILTGESRHLSFESKLDRLWRTDVRGSILVSRLVAQRMVEQPAAGPLPLIINISWDQAEAGMEGDSGQLFAPVKAAVAAFSKSLAKSFAPKLRVNCIAPGWIQTQWGRAAPVEWDRRARGESMLDRWGQPEDIAGAAIMLADPSCEFINGQTIAVNGGWKPAR